MKSHAVPQEIMRREFKLFGNFLSLREFLFIAGGIASAYFFYLLAKQGVFPPILAWPLIIILGLGGIMIGLVPIQDRSLETWISNYFKAIRRPTQRVWRKKGYNPDQNQSQDNSAISQKDYVVAPPTTSKKKVLGSTNDKTINTATPALSEEKERKLEEDELKRIEEIEQSLQSTFDQADQDTAASLTETTIQKPPTYDINKEDNNSNSNFPNMSSNINASNQQNQAQQQNQTQPPQENNTQNQGHTQPQPSQLNSSQTSNTTQSKQNNQPPSTPNQNESQSQQSQTSPQDRNTQQPPTPNQTPAQTPSSQPNAPSNQTQPQSDNPTSQSQPLSQQQATQSPSQQSQPNQTQANAPQTQSSNLGINSNQNQQASQTPKQPSAQAQPGQTPAQPGQTPGQSPTQSQSPSSSQAPAQPQTNQTNPPNSQTTNKPGNTPTNQTNPQTATQQSVPPPSAQKPLEEKQSRQITINDQNIQQYATQIPGVDIKPNTINLLVKDKSGQTINKVTCIVKNASGEPVRASISNKLGQIMNNVPLENGTYKVQLTKQGYVFPQIIRQLTGQQYPPLEISAL
jgi:hypothetical protein